MKTFIKKVLGFLGFNYCQYCGRDLKYKYTRGYNEIEVWECPHCDHLDRFDFYPVKRTRGRPKG